MSSFDKDLLIGEQIERAWGKFILNTHPVSDIEYSQGKVSGWDLRLIRDGKTSKFHEVKFDQSSAAPWVNANGNVCKPTGNLFIEHRNPRTGADSGIMATRSDWWVYIVKQAFGLVDLSEVDRYTARAYIIKADQLKEYMMSNNFRSVPTVRNTVNGKVNAEGWLLPVHSLKNSGVTHYEEDFTSYIRALFSSNL